MYINIHLFCKYNEIKYKNHIMKHTNNHSQSPGDLAYPIT